MTALDQCHRANVVRSNRAVTRQSSTAIGRHPVWDVVGAWASAGARLGLGLGAAYGAAIIALTGAAPYMLVGAVAGGLIGGACGLLVGAVNGAVLAWIAGKPRRFSPAHDRIRQATTIAVLTTGITSLVSWPSAVLG